MQAKDIMIGDWVMYDPNIFIEDEYETPKKPYPIQIACGEDIDLAMEDCYTPIPLTPEILKKNGFSPNGLDVALFDCKGDDDFVGAGFLEFVHELQHALRLCGIEKEITI